MSAHAAGFEVSTARSRSAIFTLLRVPVRGVAGWDREAIAVGGDGHERDDADTRERSVHQFMVVKLTMRCSVIFHFEVPGEQLHHRPLRIHVKGHLV